MNNDIETGFFYLQSHYYSPEWGKFLNADVFVGQVGSLLSHNMSIQVPVDPFVQIAWYKKLALIFYS